MIFHSSYRRDIFEILKSPSHTSYISFELQTEMQLSSDIVI